MSDPPVEMMASDAAGEVSERARRVQQAVREYESVGEFLDDHSESGVIQPIGGGDYDVDLLWCWNLAETSTTKKGLRRRGHSPRSADLEREEHP